MNKLILTGIAILGCLSMASAEPSAHAKSHPGRPDAGRQEKITQAVNDPTKVAGLMASMPPAERAAFAKEVLAVMKDKRQHMADQVAWAKEFGATAAALVTGAGGMKSAVEEAVASGIVNACVSGESHELSSKDTMLLAVLSKNTIEALPSGERSGMACEILQVVKMQKTPDVATHKQAVSETAVALFAGAGDAKLQVIGDVFGKAMVGDLGAVSDAMSDAFNQRKNGLTDEQYAKIELQALKDLARRVAGQPDATERMAYAIAAFDNAAANPGQSHTDLMAKLGPVLPPGIVVENLNSAIKSATVDMAANGLQHIGDVTQPTTYGPPVLGPGEGLQVPHQQTSGYQNQIIV